MVGSVFGSFATLIIERTRREESIIYPRSHCDSCNHELGFLDLFPVFSYIFLGGRCRYCKNKIGKIKIIIEFLAGFLFTITFIHFQFIKASLIFFGLLFALIISISDIKDMEIYDKHLLTFAIVALSYRIVFLGFDLEFFLICLIFSLIFLLIIFFSKGGIGEGDLFFYLLCFLYIKNNLILNFILISIWIAGFFGLVIALKLRTLKANMPLCPSIALGLFVLIFLY